MVIFFQAGDVDGWIFGGDFLELKADEWFDVNRN